ncbi:hypothetical protein BJ912DRAFT_1072320, partial [Pholiota molesta]
MAHPVIWPKKLFFYPIGNTPPVCLTQGLSPEKSAEILLLGCGDPRSILYTVYADLAPGNRHLDFTCCDWEPAVLARNILLLTMIVDGVAIDAVWSIFYHFFLDKTSHNILIAQCRTLIQISSDMNTWKDSKYGGFIRFCTEHSLREIRRHWALYAESQDLSANEREILRTSFHSGMKSVRELYAGNLITTVRAAGPLFLSVLEKDLESYTSFWTTGVTTSKTPQGISTPYVNPTFVYSLSGKKFNVHYGTNPISAFYLAPAFALRKNGKPPASTTIEDLVECAKSQFSAWCSSFKTRLSQGSAADIVIRFFVGESLAFCQALHVCKEQKTSETGVYAHPWGGLPITFREDDYSSASPTPAPLMFNVIETSNLADHAGLVNLLVVTVPLLQRKPWSIIHTNTLLRSDSLGPAKSGLNESACADIPTLSILLGVAPSPHLWHFTTHWNKHEVITSGASSGQLHESISWRFVSSFVPNAVARPQDIDPGRFILICDVKELAKFLFSLYLQMFANENLTMNFRNTVPFRSIRPGSVVHYARASFVALLSLIKGHVKVDWTQTMDHLVDLISADRSLLMGTNNCQDLMCHFYLRHVHTLEGFTSAYLETVRTPRDRFHGWKDVPPVVCIVLKVPRHHLKPLEDMDPDDIKTPMLQGEMFPGAFHNIHSSIHLTFGDIQGSVVEGESQVTIKEDPKGWSGSSSLIATFYVPSWTLTIAPTSTRVGLHIRNTPSTISLIPKLGMYLTIFSASLTDTAHVQVVRHRPGNAREVEYLRKTPSSSSATDSEIVTMKFDPSGERATNLISRKDITDPGAASSLAGGSKVSTTPITDSCVLVTFGHYSYRFTYPFPVQMKKLQTRIARKSSYIEVELPIRADFSDSHNLSLNPFPVAHNDSQINLLNINYLNLDILPALSLPGKEKDLKWLSIHSGTMFSDAEKQAKAHPDQEERGAFVNLKESIGCMLLKYAGLQLDNAKDWSSIFGLTDPRNGGVYTLIFVNAIKLDLASHSVVIDACVVPLVDKIMSKIRPALQALLNRKFIHIITHADESRAWRLLLPTLSERCRTWKHTAACEYQAKGVPVSLVVGEHSPLCNCGKGKNLGRFKTVSEWKLFHEEATRVAIGPLFTFSFLEETSRVIAKALDAPEGTHLPNSEQCAKCGGPGKPKLLVCTVCKKTQYCSRECQKGDWKAHKKMCAARK